MELNVRISRLKSITLKRIEESAKKGDTASIFSNTAAVEEVERLEKKLNEIVVALENVEKRTNSTSNAAREILHSQQTSNLIEALVVESSPREVGKIRRKEFIRELSMLGTQLYHAGGCIYKTKTQNLVGIAYASERKPNRWFLGLPIKDYYAVILLCERGNGTILKFVLPKVFLIDKKEHISNADGNFKYNIVSRHGEFSIRIPKVGNDSVSKFLNNYAPLAE